MQEEINITNEEFEVETKNYTKLIIVGIIIAAVLFFILFKMGAIGGAVAATVNNKSIYLSDVENAYNDYLKESKTKPKTNQENYIKSQILDRMVADEVIKQVLKKEKITISKKEVEDRINKLKDKQGSAKFKNNLKKNSWTEDDLFVFIKGEIFREKLHKKLKDKDYPLNIVNYLYNFRRNAKIIIKIDKLNIPTTKLELIPPVKNFKAIKG